MIPESDFSESGDGERPKSSEIAIDSDISDETTHETWPGCVPSLPPFTVNASWNALIQHTDVISFVKLFIIEDFRAHVCDPTNVYICQAITAASYPFPKHSLFRT